MHQFLVVFCASVLGGFVQSVTGFGGAIIVMIFLPTLFPMGNASALSDVITMSLSMSMFYRYRKYVKFRSILFPALIYLVVSTVSIYAMADLDGRLLKGLFGIFLIGLALYFMCFSEKFKFTPSIGKNSFCAALSGACGGLFAISGPPVSLYYLSVCEQKEEYLGTLNAFFSVTVLFNIAARASNHFYTAELLPYMAEGIFFILIGCSIGNRASAKMPLSAIKKSVYLLMIFAGALALIQLSVGS